MRNKILLFLIAVIFVYLSSIFYQKLTSKKIMLNEIIKISSVGLGGPYNIMFRSPVFADRMKRLLDYLRFNTSLPTRLNEFAAIVAKHPQVQRIVCGHVHRAIQSQFAGTLALTCPGAAHQIHFDMTDDAPAAFTFEPAGLMLQ